MIKQDHSWSQHVIANHINTDQAQQMSLTCSKHALTSAGYDAASSNIGSSCCSFSAPQEHKKNVFTSLEKIGRAIV